jgi:hypothetical protein
MNQQEKEAAAHLQLRPSFMALRVARKTKVGIFLHSFGELSKAKARDGGSCKWNWSDDLDTLQLTRISSHWPHSIEFAWKREN